MLTQISIAALMFLFGATIGSFLHVIALRLPQGKSFTGSSRSACPKCHRTLHWYELIPVISYVMQRGRCRSCSYKIPPRYLFVEILTGLIVTTLLWPALVTMTASTFPIILLKVIIISLLIILFIIDADTFLLPDKIILVLLLAALLHQGLLGELSQPSPYLGIAVGAGFLGALFLATRGRGLGLGDVKLMIPLGLLFGPSNTAILLFLAFGSGAVVALYLLATKQATRKTAIPFGPYLCGAAILLMLYPNLTAQITTFLGY